MTNREPNIPAIADIIHEVLSFSGGMNTRASALYLGKEGRYALHKDEAPLLINWCRDASGALSTRPGREKLNSTAVTPPSGDSTIRSLFELTPLSGSTTILMNAGNTVYKWNGTTWISLGTVATANKRMHWCQFNDTAIGVDGTNLPIETDGTSYANLSGSPPQGAIAVLSHRNRVWMLKGRTLYYSAVGAKNDWTTANNAGSVPIPTTRGGGGTAMFSLWDRIIICTTDNVFQLTGSSPATFAIEPITVAYGHELSPYGMLAAGNDVYFGSSKGVHAMSVSYGQSITGDVSYNYVSAKIEPTWQSINKTNFGNVAAVHDSKRNVMIFLCSRAGANNNEAMVADYYHMDDQGRPTWSLYANMPFACGAEVRSLNNETVVLFGGYDGIVYRQTNSAKDVDSNIDLQIQYVTDGDVPTMDKTWRYMTVFLNTTGAVLTGTVSYDFNSSVHPIAEVFNTEVGGLIGSTFVMGHTALGTSSYKQRRIPIPGIGRFAVLNLNISASVRVSFGGAIFYAGIRRAIHG